MAQHFDSPHRGLLGTGSTVTASVPRGYGAGAGRGAVVVRFALLGIVVLAAAVRLYGLTASSFDMDEAFSVWVAQHDPSAIWSVLVRFDDHPPLFYLGLHYWRQVFGDSAFSLRLFPVLCGVLTIPVVYRLGRTIGGESVGLLSAALLAIAPLHVEWSREVRMFALEILALAVAMDGLARMLEDPDAGWTPWVAYTAGTAAALWTEYTAALFPIIATLVVAARWLTVPRPWGRALGRRWVAANLVAALFCLPLVPMLTQQIRGPNVVSWYEANLHALVDAFRLLFVGPAFVNHAAPEIYLLGVVLGVMAFLAWRDRPIWIVFASALTILPGLIIFAVALRHPIFDKRAFLWSSLPLCVVVATGLLRLMRYRALFAAVMVFVVVLNANGLWNAYREDWMQSPVRGWDRAVRHVAANVRQGDLVMVFVPYVQLAWDYYAREARLSVAEAGVPVNFGEGSRTWPALTSEDIPHIRGIASGHDRIWLVTGTYTPPTTILAALAGEFQVSSSQQVSKAITVSLYERGR